MNNKYKLSTFFSIIRSDKVYMHSYGDVYDKISSIIKVKMLLEIGVLRGASINAFGLHFKDAKVYGIDCNKKTIENCQLISENVSLFHGDGTDGNVYRKYFPDFKFNIIVDDASHKPAHQIKSFNILRPYLDCMGVYIIEDVTEELLKNEIFCEDFILYDGRKLKNRFDDMMLIYTQNNNILNGLGELSNIYSKKT